MQSNDEDGNNGVTYMIYGSSGSGKSTLLKNVFFNHIYSENADKDYIVYVFTESKFSDALRDLPKCLIMDYAGLDEDVINFAYLQNMEFQKRYNFVFVLDDVIGLRFHNVLEKCLLVYRNSNISTIISIQYPKKVPISMRSCAYQIICLPFNSSEATEIVVRACVSKYVPGNNIQEKISNYNDWAHHYKGFYVDNLNHKGYRFDSDYQCTELPPITIRNCMSLESQRNQSIWDANTNTNTNTDTIENEEE